MVAHEAEGDDENVLPPLLGYLLDAVEYVGAEPGHGGLACALVREAPGFDARSLGDLGGALRQLRRVRVAGFEYDGGQAVRGEQDFDLGSVGVEPRQRVGHSPGDEVQEQGVGAPAFHEAGRRWRVQVREAALHYLLVSGNAHLGVVGRERERDQFIHTVGGYLVQSLGYVGMPVLHAYIDAPLGVGVPVEPLLEQVGYALGYLQQGRLSADHAVSLGEFCHRFGAGSAAPAYVAVVGFHFAQVAGRSVGHQKRAF